MPLSSRENGERNGSGELHRGLVVAAHGRRYRIELEGGGEVDCMTRGKRSDAACGDRVLIQMTGSRVGVIESIEPRSSVFYRSDARRKKVIAANVTQIVIVVAAAPPYSEDLVNRCLAGAEHALIGALIVFNKIDLPDARDALDALSLYRNLGYSVVALAAKRDLAPLIPHLTNEVSVLVGQSGMGKSTIVNTLIPDAAARVSDISTALGTGRHTTTHAELYHLAGGGDIIDSPGLQEFALHHFTAEDASHAFAEFRPWLGRCRFRDCRHTGEPDCAISEAASRGEISERRLASYRRVANELARKRKW